MEYPAASLSVAPPLPSSPQLFVSVSQTKMTTTNPSPAPFFGRILAVFWPYLAPRAPIPRLKRRVPPSKQGSHPWFWAGKGVQEGVGTKKNGANFLGNGPRKGK